MQNIICCRVCIDNIYLHAWSLLNLVVEFVSISAPWQAPKHYYSEVHSLWGKGHQNTPSLSPTQTHVSGFEAARPQQGHWAIVVMVDWKYRTPCRKTSLAERLHFTLGLCKLRSLLRPKLLPNYGSLVFLCSFCKKQKDKAGSAIIVANPNSSKHKVDKRVRSSDQQNRSLYTQISTNYTYTTNARADSGATKLR